MHLLEDIRAYRKNDPAARSAVEVILLYNGLHATIDYRIAHWFYRHRCFFIARAISQWSKMWTGIEIHPGAIIGRRLVIDHGTGIVIGETAEIGDDCLLYQGVTLGGTGKDVGKRHPTLGNNVMARCARQIRRSSCRPYIKHPACTACRTRSARRSARRRTTAASRSPSSAGW